ncbi:hypothetical protein IGI04_040962, partial [Brassica rapa subsp. trilocularis]
LGISSEYSEAFPTIPAFAFRVSVSSEKPRNIPRKFRGTLVFPRNFLGIFQGFSEEIGFLNRKQRFVK